MLKYKAVDLGLSVKWADRNVGAENIQDYGDYFMWGSVTPDTNNVCDWAHAPFNGGSSAFDEKHYCEHCREWLTDKGILKPEYDAAHAIMGGSWRMPTSEEIQELLDWTTKKNGMLEGVIGTFLTSRVNGNSIFMPLSGDRDDSDVCGVGGYGQAWSSSILKGYIGINQSGLSYHLSFGNGRADLNYFYRYSGLAVRGVRI